MTVDRIPITGLELNNLTLILDNGIETAGAINVVRVLVVELGNLGTVS